MPIRILNIRYIFPWIFPRRTFTVFKTNGEYYVKLKIHELQLSVYHKDFDIMARDFKRMISLAISQGNLSQETRKELHKHFDIGLYYLLLEIAIWIVKSYVGIILAPLWIINSFGGRGK